MYLVQEHSLAEVKKLAKRISNFHRTRKWWSWDAKTVPLTLEAGTCNHHSAQSGLPSCLHPQTHAFFALAVAVLFPERAAFHHLEPDLYHLRDANTSQLVFLLRGWHSGPWGPPAKHRNTRTSWAASPTPEI